MIDTHLVTCFSDKKLNHMQSVHSLSFLTQKNTNETANEASKRHEEARMTVELSTHPTPSRLAVLRNSFPAFKNRIKIRENRGLCTVLITPLYIDEYILALQWEKSLSKTQEPQLKLQSTDTALILNTLIY